MLNFLFIDEDKCENENFSEECSEKFVCPLSLSKRSLEKDMSILNELVVISGPAF